MEIKQLLYIPEKKKWEIQLLDLNRDIQSLVLDEETILHFELICGKSISDSLFQDIVDFEKEHAYYLISVHYLQRRRTTSEVVDFLKYKHDLDTVTISKIIKKLIDQKYLDDFAYGKAYIHDKIIFQKKSLNDCLSKLKEKGLSHLLIEELMYNAQENTALIQSEYDNLVFYIQKQIQSLKQYNLFERNQRIIAKMRQKGYNKDSIIKVLNDYTDIEPMSEYDKLQLFRKTRSKMVKMKNVSTYVMYMKKYNITSEEVINFFNDERMK
ncbi:MAG: regulatory protein RecX [Culicoidibacterales bacterium]